MSSYVVVLLHTYICLFSYNLHYVLPTYVHAEIPDSVIMCLHVCMYLHYVRMHISSAAWPDSAMLQDTTWAYMLCLSSCIIGF